MKTTHSPLPPVTGLEQALHQVAVDNGYKSWNDALIQNVKSHKRIIEMRRQAHSLLAEI